VSTPRSRTPLIIGIVLAVVAVAAIVAVLTSGGDDGDAASCSTTPLESSETVSVEGGALPQGEGADDPCIGVAVPTISGTDYAGDPVTITPGADGPLMIVVMAHWCPHCNREVPLLVDWEESGDVPDGLTVVGLSTAVNEDRPNFPPGAWLDDLGWDWPVIADDEPQTGAIALGTTGYPSMVFIGADGTVVGRYSGELPIEAVQQLADATVATAAAG
jgi:cytochrome c biogenesis protein CcmG/thiol:disulfide interchange protein DsbE